MAVSSWTRWLQGIALIDKATKGVVAVLNSFYKVVKAFAGEAEFCSFYLAFERGFILRWDLGWYISLPYWLAVDGTHLAVFVQAESFLEFVEGIF